MNDPLSVFAEALAQRGMVSSKPLRITSKIERFMPVGDHQDNGWYVLYNLTHCVVGSYGCWKRGFKEKFSSRDKSQMSVQEWSEVQKSWQNAEVARREEEERLQAKARSDCAKLFQVALRVQDNHGYLLKKGVKPYGNLRISDNVLTKDWMALPLQDEKGTLHSAQFIADDGAKRFCYGGRMQGCYFVMADTVETPLVICEGYATGASIHEATGWAVVCALTANNLPVVATTLRRLHKERLIVIAADNDQFTEGNPGMIKGAAASHAAKGVLAYPEFETLGQKPTDFNDLHRLEGLASVKRRLLEAAKLGGDWDLLLEDAGDTMSKVIPAPVEIIEGLVCEQAKMVIGGSSKTYKTWFSMDAAMSLSAGVLFLGRKTKKSRVLYVNFELKQQTFEARLQTIAKAKGIHFDYQQFFHLHLKGQTGGLNATRIVDKILALARKRKVSVIVLDPLYKMNSGTKNENESGEQTAFLLEIDRLVTQAGATVIFDDHFSKGNQSDKDPLDAIRGSSVKGGDVDAAIIIRAHKEKGSFTVSVVQRELPPVDDFVITWQYPLFDLNETLDPTEMKKPKGGRPATVESVTLLWAFETTTPESGLTVTSVATKTGVSRQSLSQRHLPSLRAKGWIATAGEGSTARQYITVKGSEILRKLTGTQ